jgi:uncharacterized delta-60 repeat protein
MVATMANPGDLDTSFSGDGKRVIGFGGTDAARAVVVASQSRILVAGRGGPTPSFCVARLRSDGALDTTFGSAGKVRIDVGGDTFRGATGIALQTDGKIVVAGQSNSRVVVARLRPNGLLDKTFSADGKLTFNWGAGFLVAIGVAGVIALPTGKLLVGGYSGPETGNMQAARLNANGSLDTSFGTGGIATADFGGDEFANAMARQANGRILLAGRSQPTFTSDPPTAVVARLRANGALDPDFGGDGRVSLGAGNLVAVLVQEDRKILVAGQPSEGGGSHRVTRLNTNGSIDTGFGSAGTATIDIGVSDAALQADGRIVVVASASDGFGVARLNPDGSRDTTFGNAGNATVEFGATGLAFATALQPNGRIVVAGQQTDGDNFAVARLLG